MGRRDRTVEADRRRHHGRRADELRLLAHDELLRVAVEGPAVHAQAEGLQFADPYR